MRPGYLWGEVRRIIRRSGAIAVRNLPAALGRGMLLDALGASDGMGGAVPLRDGRNAVVAPVLVPGTGRHPLFAAPLTVPATATPSDRLAAYLGRTPPA